MRLRTQIIGGLNLFRATAGPFGDEETRIGQALADVATISLLNERSLRRSETLNEQLQSALNSRVTIEQAKGKLAERLQVDMDRAFELLRNYARSRNRRLSEMAREFVDGSEQLADLSAAPPSPRRAPRPGPPR
jgi:GAF domain-containing protein